ncbi:hypothetical protein B1A99_08615 [Cohnella sp. CIP 111063]|uniref:helix-turn-helix domain-containing protein n=1 Tax=unclassified Cohnella TaxID=2636738 RepID=UPI000B8BC185|nr:MULTISPECIES: helix-turn-helix domain-containing protein [unclassified Cohnella]OXS60475.1 hypothetical protein B1A99_08615 [Cohnella sp. CIP 111063]PRX73181.1 helix-turn-helix protein [Cohnella sp. SGD-V74]
MRAFEFFKSKKYFQRVMFSIALAMALILTCLSVVNTYVLERSVRKAQEDSNLKVLTQIQYNLNYMNEMITHLASFALKDNFLTPLLFSDPIPAMDYIRGYNEMNKLMESASFLHSMAVYNARSGELYGSSSNFLLDDGKTKQRMMEWLIDARRPHLPYRLIPIGLTEEGGPVDAFAFIVTDAYKPFLGEESALILYIKPDWVFDSLRRMNDAGSGIQGEVYIRTADGRLLAGGERALREAPSEAAIAALIEGNGSSGFVIGDAGDGKSVVTYMEGIGDWTILYVQSYRTLMQDVDKARTSSLLVAGAFLLLSVGVSVWLSYRLYHPIETMLRRIRPHLGRGDRDDAAGNELDAMGDNVLRMSERLQEISSEQIVRKYYLRKFLTDSGMFAEHDMKQLIGKHGLNLSSEASLTAIVLRIDRYTAYDSSTPGSAKKLHSFAIVNIAHELLSSAFACEAAEMQADHAVLVVSGMDGEEGLARAKRLVGDLQHTIERFYGLSLTCGISRPVARCTQLSSAYRQAYQASLYLFVFGYRSIVTPDDIRSHLAEAPKLLPPDIERRLAEALKKGRLDEAGNELERAFSLLQTFTYEDMRRAVSDLAWAIENTSADIARNRIASAPADTDRIHRTGEDNVTLEDMYLAFLASCARICEGSKASGVERTELIVGTVRELIERKFADPNLSQQSIAANVKLTSAYTGKLFKEREGVTITEYINEVRLEHARKLLLQTDDTIAEIMDKCGYGNQSHFFRLFKAKFGSTPKEYRLKRSLS